MTTGDRIDGRTRFLLALHLGVGPVLGLATGGAMVGLALAMPRGPAGDPAFWILLVVGMASGFLPSSFAAISAGVRGGLSDFPIYLAAMTFAAFVPWWILRRGPREALRAELERHPPLVRFLGIVDRSPLPLLLGIRLAPFAVFAWTNALFAISRIRTPAYLLGTAIGAVPRALAMFAAGSGARSLSEALRKGEDPTARALLLGFGILGVLVLAAVVGKALLERPEAPSGEAPRSGMD